MIKYTCLCNFTGYYNNQSIQFTTGQEILVEEPVLSLEIAVNNSWAVKEILSELTKNLHKLAKRKK